MLLFGRYMFLLMGFFAVFNGLCYNEFFALPIQATWGTCFKEDPNTIIEHPEIKNGSKTVNDFDRYLVPIEDCVYPIGVDYVWGLANNKLAFTNVMKMKISVILAIAQMSIGIIIKAINASYKKDRIQFYFEFIPMLTLLLVLFGWMDVLIIGKWLINWKTAHAEQIVDKVVINYDGRNAAPAVIPTMINNFLNMGSQDIYIFEENTQKTIS
jgi:V-type H+-transporting ATPase subunit a